MAIRLTILASYALSSLDFTVRIPFGVRWLLAGSLTPGSAHIPDRHYFERATLEQLLRQVVRLEAGTAPILRPHRQTVLLGAAIVF